MSVPSGEVGKSWEALTFGECQSKAFVVGLGHHDLPSRIKSWDILNYQTDRDIQIRQRHTSFKPFHDISLHFQNRCCSTIGCRQSHFSNNTCVASLHHCVWGTSSPCTGIRLSPYTSSPVLCISIYAKDVFLTELVSWQVRKLLSCHPLLKLIKSLWLVISVYCRDSDLWLMPNTHLFQNWFSSARSPASETTASHVISTSSSLMSSSVVEKFWLWLYFRHCQVGYPTGTRARWYYTFMLLSVRSSDSSGTSKSIFLHACCRCPWFPGTVTSVVLHSNLVLITTQNTRPRGNLVHTTWNCGTGPSTKRSG